ncbi:HNH endonuclease, partial [Gordonia sp. NPDC003424]
MSPTTGSAAAPLWRGLPAGFVGGVDLEEIDETPTNDLLAGMGDLDRGHAYLAYRDYRSAAVLYDRFVAAREDTDGFVVDGFADAATRISQS